LSTQIPFGRPIIGKDERDAVMKVMEGSILVHGPQAIRFEEDFAAFTRAPHAVSVSSCTAGMHLVYFALGIGAGDEVVVPAMTHVATAHAVELTGARAVFVDVEGGTGNIDITAIEAAITPRTRAIAVVHYLGVPVDMPKVVEIAKKHGLFLLEDCALAPGAWIDGIHAGLHGDAGVFSFYPVKHLTTAEGGMIILRDAELAARLKLVKAFGVDRTHGERKVPGVYDTVALGFNYRMSEIHAAIGVEQLKKLPRFLEQRRENFVALEQGLEDLSGIRVLPQPSGGRLQSCHYCLGALLDENLVDRRPDIMAALGERGIGTSVYYPQPVPRMTYYREKYGHDAGPWRNSARISDGMIALPVGPHLDIGHMKIIADAFRDVIKGLTS
jgi:dTDP-4-amino-4,6-dideoxygalactose transaminase